MMITRFSYVHIMSSIIMINAFMIYCGVLFSVTQKGRIWGICHENVIAIYLCDI